MTHTVGFVIISHNYPKQLARLVCRLQTVFDNPPIAVHHDFGQSTLDPIDFSTNVAFVEPHLRTRWGRFSVVNSVLLALKLLYDRSDPQWFFLLSGTDYPVCGAEKMMNDLGRQNVDALLDYRQIPDIGDEKPLPVPKNAALLNFTLPHNAELAYRRYIGLNFWVPTIQKGPRIGRKIFYLAMKDWRSPFDQDFKGYYGDLWFAGNQRVAETLLNPTAKHLQLQRHLKSRTLPDECYFNTILANSDLRISTDTKRFMKWPLGGAHPKELSTDDLTEILDSGAFFARKFTPDSPILNEIDKRLRR